MTLLDDLDDIRTLQLGDMTVVGRWPAKLMKALAVISIGLHDAYNKVPNSTADFSKQACLFSSLAVRDFLVDIGFTDATVRGVACIMKSADSDNETLYSLGIGVPDQPSIKDKFNGHAVCTIPAVGIMIDTTLYPSIRPQWHGAVTGMFAVRYDQPGETKVADRYPIAGVEMLDEAGVTFGIIWTDRPELQWKRSVDFVRTPRRRAVSRALVEMFGEWHD